MSNIFRALFFLSIIFSCTPYLSAAMVKVAKQTETEKLIRKANDHFRMAIALCNLPSAEAALIAGADINTQTFDQDGSTALMYVTEKIHYDVYISVFEWLLEHGADFFAQDKKNRTIYDHAYYHNFKRILDHPLHTKVVTAKLVAIFSEYTTIYIPDLINLIQEYALCGPTTANLNSALFMATWDFDAERVGTFLHWGADCNARNKRFETILTHIPRIGLRLDGGHRTEYENTCNIVELLVAYGVDTKAINNAGQTALQCAQFYAGNGHYHRREFVQKVAKLYEKVFAEEKMRNQTRRKLCS